jgi:hypothetical protein
MDIKELEILLENTTYSSFIGHIKNVGLKNYTYKDLFKIGNETLGYFSLKIRKRNNKNITKTERRIKVYNNGRYEYR